MPIAPDLPPALAVEFHFQGIPVDREPSDERFCRPAVKHPSVRLHLLKDV